MIARETIGGQAFADSTPAFASQAKRTLNCYAPGGYSSEASYHSYGGGYRSDSGCSESSRGSRGCVAGALFNIRSGRIGSLESTLRAMAAMDADFGILAETKITGGFYTHFSSGYNVFASNAVSVRQGGVALFWKPNKLYEIKEWRVRGQNIITFVVVTSVEWYYAVGCYIPPNNLTTLTHVEGAWNDCPKGHILILLGDLNINLVSPRNE